MISQILSINNYKTESGKSINLHIIRKVIEYSLRSGGVKKILTVNDFELLMFKGRSVKVLLQQVQESQRIYF